MIQFASERSNPCFSPISSLTTHPLDGNGLRNDDTARRTPCTDRSALPGTESSIQVCFGMRNPADNDDDGDDDDGVEAARMTE